MDQSLDRFSKSESCERGDVVVLELVVGQDERRRTIARLENQKPLTLKCKLRKRTITDGIYMHNHLAEQQFPGL